MIVVDPRRTESAAWADLWLGIDVGTDIALSNTIAREIIASDLHDKAFIENATENFESYAASVMDWTLERGAAETGIPASVIQEVAHAYASADKAMICWTLGITEHHTGDRQRALADQPGAAHRARRAATAAGSTRFAVRTTCRAAVTWAPSRTSCPGFKTSTSDVEARERFERAWGCTISPEPGWHLSQMFEAMERGDLTACYVIGENPASSDADTTRARRLLEELDCLIVQDIVMTKTAELADVVLPASNGAFESEGTVTNSERRVQLVRKALDPPGQARDDIWIIAQLANRLGGDWGEVTAARGMGGAALALADARGHELGAAGRARRHPLAVPGRVAPRHALPARAAVVERSRRARVAPRRSASVVHEPPVDRLTKEFPIRLTTGRRLEAYNTGVQSGSIGSPLDRPEAIELSPDRRRVARHGARREGAGLVAARIDRGAGPHLDGAPRRGSRS